MKRYIACFLALLMLVALCACAGEPQKETDRSKEQTAAASSGVTADKTESPTETESTAAEQAAEEPVSGDPSQAETVSPLLWKVTDQEGRELYLFGTCHVGDERNEAVLERLAPILETCDALAVEFDMIAYENDTSQMTRDYAQYMLTDGSTIEDYMPEEMYQRMCDLLKRAGLYSALYNRYNLAWWDQLAESAMLVVGTDLETEKAMDTLLILYAYEHGLPVLDIESGTFQITLMNSFDNELYLLLIEDLLDSEDTYDSDLKELYALWLSGDRDAFWKYIEDDDVSDADDEVELTQEQVAMLEDLNRRLIDDRNFGMRDKAVEYLASGETVFFAVGAAHMANETGIVQLLSEAGYTVEPIQY